MKPISFKEQNTVVAEDQDEYLDLPALHLRNREGEVITKWKMTWGERFQVLFTGVVWHSLWTFNTPLQPQSMGVAVPEGVKARRVGTPQPLGCIMQGAFMGTCFVLLLCWLGCSRKPEVSPVLNSEASAVAIAKEAMVQRILAPESSDARETLRKDGVVPIQRIPPPPVPSSEEEKIPQFEHIPVPGTSP